ncbi:MAG: hypothetical protein OEY52_01695 [Gammaproteobacteria bacterium]|nr:hypothetical protein [Gammaproteobacteria bacterium]
MRNSIVYFVFLSTAFSVSASEPEKYEDAVKQSNIQSAFESKEKTINVTPLTEEEHKNTVGGSPVLHIIG